MNLKEYRRVSLSESSAYSDQQMLMRLYKKEEPKPVPIEIGENDIILGWPDTHFRKENVVRLNLNIFSKDNKENINMGFVGLTGTGKSLEAWKVVEDFVFRHDNCFFGYDVKGEAHWHKKPMASLPHLDKLDFLGEQIGVKRQGLDLLIVAPKGLDDGNVDRHFAVSWEDIQELADVDSGEAVKTMSELCGLNDYDEDCIDILDSEIENPKVKSFADLVKRLEKMDEDKLPGSAKLLRRVKNRMGRVLSDEKEDKFDLLHEMKERQGKGGVIFRGKIKVAGTGNYADMAYEAMLKICLTKIMYDGFSWNLSRNPRAVLKTDTVVLLEELDTLAPDDSRNHMSLYMRNYATKGRQALLNLLFVVQEVSTVDEQLWQQVRIIFASKVSPGNAKALSNKGVPDYTIDEIQSMRIEIPVDFGYKVPERCVIGKNNETIRYLGRWPCSQFPPSTR